MGNSTLVGRGIDAPACPTGKVASKNMHNGQRFDDERCSVFTSISSRRMVIDHHALLWLCSSTGLYDRKGQDCYTASPERTRLCA